MNKNEDLKEMFESATKEDNKVDSSSNTSKKIIIASALIVTSLVAMLALSKLKIKPQEFEDLTDTNVNILEDFEDGFASFSYPVKIPAWSKEPFNISSIENEDEIYDELMTFSKKQQHLSGLFESLPSKFSGEWLDAPPAYTNDITQKTIDGHPNRNFAYALKEDYMIAYSTYINRLINPVFGDWIYQQRDFPLRPMKADPNFRVLAGMFHPDWWKENIVENEDYSKLPILADWNGDNFADSTLSPRNEETIGVWYGELNVNEDNMISTEYLGRDENEAHIVEIITPIKYYAWGENNKKVNKSANLRMRLASNPVAYMPNRVVITDIELILE